MIQKTLLITTLSLTLYSALIYWFGHDISRTGQTVAQRNLVKAEEYRYEAAEQFDTLIVGSSMSERIPTDSLASSCYNLAMAGLSSQAGLKLIRESGHWPRLIYVEMNTLLTPVRPNELLIDQETPVEQFMHEHLAFLRQKYQPIGVFKALLRDWQYGKNQVVAVETGLRVDSAFLEKAVAKALLDQQRPLPDSVLRAQVKFVKHELDTFRQHGTQIILFEVPVDPRIQQTAFSRAIKTAITDTFSALDYTLVMPDSSAVYSTTDGVHLTYGACFDYTHHLCTTLRTPRLQMPNGVRLVSNQP